MRGGCHGRSRSAVDIAETELVQLLLQLLLHLCHLLLLLQHVLHLVMVHMLHMHGVSWKKGMGMGEECISEDAGGGVKWLGW